VYHLELDSTELSPASIVKRIHEGAKAWARS